MRGHKAGTRETYVEDNSSETGYRKLSMDEELAELDKAYQGYTERFAARYDKKTLSGLAAQAEKVSRLSSGRAKIAGEAKDVLDKLQKENTPENLSERMMKAAQNFTQRYNKTIQTTVDMTSLLKGISAF